jgi:hypothetical protein
VRLTEHPVTGSLKFRGHGFITGRCVIRVLETTKFLWVTVRTTTGVLVGKSILASRTIVRARITTRANSSNAHAHGKIVTFDTRNLWAGCDTMVLTIAKETAAVTFLVFV